MDTEDRQLKSNYWHGTQEFTSLSGFHNSCNNTGLHANVKLLNESALYDGTCIRSSSLRTIHVLRCQIRLYYIYIFCIKMYFLCTNIILKLLKCMFFILFAYPSLTLFNAMHKTLYVQLLRQDNSLRYILTDPIKSNVYPN